MNPLRILIVGTGQMGHAIELESVRSGHQIVGRTNRLVNEHHEILGGEILGGENAVDVAMEFTHADAVRENVRRLLEAGIPVVSGTTGWSPQEIADLAVETQTPFLHAANFSIGIAVMKRIASLANAMLQPFPEFEPALVERHHSKKKDSPSGTAKMLQSTLAESREEQVPIVALRQGGIAGEHQLIFEGTSESLTLTHTAHSRQIFALGAVRAAEWLVRERPVGLVNIDAFLEGTQTWMTSV